LGVFLEVKIRDILKVQGVKNHSGETKRMKSEVLEIRQWRRVYLCRFQILLGRWRYQTLTKYSKGDQNKIE